MFYIMEKTSIIFQKQYRSILGYVPQECGLPDYMKVKKSSIINFSI